MHLVSFTLLNIMNEFQCKMKTQWLAYSWVGIEYARNEYCYAKVSPRERLECINI